MLLIEHPYNGTSPATERLSLTFELRTRSRLRTKLESGEEAGLFLERGTVLRGGDKLQANDGRIVEVASAPESLMEAASNDPLALARAAYHLGNRHVAVELQTTCLRFATDHVLGEMVRGLGLPITEMVAPFEPEGGAYGQAHTHGHSADGEGRGPRIHEFRKPA